MSRIDGHIRLSIALATAALAALAPAAASAGIAAKTPALVFATAPSNQTVRDLIDGRLAEKVRCSRSCDTTTTIYIRPTLAKQLGFSAVNPRIMYAIGQTSARLSAKKITAVTISVSTEAKRNLTRADRPFQVVGQVIAHPRTGSRTTEASTWIATVGV